MITLLTLFSTFARAEEPTAGKEELLAYPEYTVRANDGSFVIEQRTTRAPGNWQTWIRHRGSDTPPYRLSLWMNDLCWASLFHISPDRRHLFHTQKTGSGDNYGSLFTRGNDGKYHLLGQPHPSPSLEDLAWDFFRKKSGLKALCYHHGFEFVAWGSDGKCIELSLHGTDVHEDYYIDGWKFHFNIATRRFFLTPDQKAPNKHAIVIRHPERE